MRYTNLVSVGPPLDGRTSLYDIWHMLGTRITHDFSITHYLLAKWAGLTLKLTVSSTSWRGSIIQPPGLTIRNSFDWFKLWLTLKGSKITRKQKHRSHDPTNEYIVKDSSTFVVAMTSTTSSSVSLILLPIPCSISLSSSDLSSVLSTPITDDLAAHAAVE